MSGGGGAARTATVLFTHVVGSTELRQRLGEDEADALQRLHDELLSSVIEGAEGRVVKGLGDGILAVFESAADAVEAAVAAQQAVAEHSRREPLRAFTIRVGLSAGDVGVTGGGDVHGSAVVEASRLCGVAQPGQILAADLVRALARGRGGFQFESVGELDLRGLEDPVPACFVTWEPVGATAEVGVPFPSLLVPPAGVAYVGRADLLQLLEAGWIEVSSGGGSRGVLLSGEPGIGKTRTAGEIGRRAHEKGALVLYGRCDEALSTPYQPFVEALDWQTVHDAELPLGRYAGELTRLVPDLPDRVGGLAHPVAADPRVEQHRLFEAVASWLVDVSRDRGLVLVVDDLHWAGLPTLQLLSHVLRAVTADPAAQTLVIGTYRDTDVDRQHPLSSTLGDLRRMARVDRVTVDNLTADDVVELAEAAAGHPLDQTARRLASFAYAETEGNPFFVGEVLRHFIETEVVRFVEGRWVVGQPDQVDVPEGIRDVVGRRLSRQSETTNDVLHAAAVLGRDADLDVLTRLVGVAYEAVLDSVDEALRARLIEETGPDRIRFAHAIVRTTLYEELSASRRRRMHRRAVEVLEDCAPDDVEALAHHALQAGPLAGRLDRAARYAVAAGERALDQRAHADALAWFKQALEVLDEDPGEDPRLELTARCGIGHAQRDLGDRAYRDTLLDVTRRALEADLVELAVRAAVANSRLVPSIIGAADAEKVAVLEPRPRRSSSGWPSRPAPNSRRTTATSTPAGGSMTRRCVSARSSESPMRVAGGARSWDRSPGLTARSGTCPTNSRRSLTPIRTPSPGGPLTP